MTSQKIPEALLTYIRGMKDDYDAVGEIMHALFGFDLRLMPLAQSQAQTKTTKPNANTSKQKIYWIKTVASYDPKVPNGYGINGKFLTPSKVKDLKTGTFFVVHDRADGITHLCHKKNPDGSNITVSIARGSTVLVLEDSEFVNSFSDYGSLYTALGTLGIGQFTASKNT